MVVREIDFVEWVTSTVFILIRVINYFIFNNSATFLFCKFMENNLLQVTGSRMKIAKIAHVTVRT